VKTNLNAFDINHNIFVDSDLFPINLLLNQFVLIFFGLGLKWAVIFNKEIIMQLNNLNLCAD
jgi:hypothetical protein